MSYSLFANRHTRVSPTNVRGWRGPTLICGPSRTLRRNLRVTPCALARQIIRRSQPPDDERGGSHMTHGATAAAGRRQWIGLGILTLPCALYATDLTVLNLAGPQISAALHPTGEQL